MPLVRLDVKRGRTKEQLSRLADSAHAAVVEALNVPPSDRYQIITQHDQDEVVAEDTDLGIPRTEGLVMIEIVSRRRAREQKLKLYELLARNLERDVGLAASDLIVAVTENGDDDWSFGLGRAQFVTGELV